MFGQDDNQQPAQNQDTNSALQAALPDPIDDSAQDTGLPANPAFGAPSSAPSIAEPLISPSGTVLPNDTATASTTPVPGGHNNDELLNLKQQALQSLSPLVSHLDQTPEEKFRTTMMMIQASDDQTLIKAAFEAAQAITDDKARAQALLDIINEINYFTQHQK